MSLRRSLIALAAVAATAGCVTPPRPGPEDAAEAYARALREGRMDDAYALTASTQRAAGLTREEFQRRYGNAEARTARAGSIDSALPELTARAGTLTLVREADGWRVLEPVGDGGAKKTLDAFVSAAEAGDFRAAYALLSESLRARYTPERLEADFKAEPQAKERLARARAALANEPVLEGDRALFPIGEGKAVRLRLEDGGFRVVSLE